MQRSAMRAWDEERDFRELVREDPEIADTLGEAVLGNVFELELAVQHVDTVFERLRSLVDSAAAVHA